MSQYLLLNRIKVQGANAVAGFTWGFPAITHFLGFSHNLFRKLNKRNEFSGISLSGCGVIAHKQQVHTYAYNQFVQSRNPAFQHNEQPKNKVGTPPVIEEGKMDMEVSLLIECKGNIGNRQVSLVEWFEKVIPIQRLAGGSIMNIGRIEIYRVDDNNSQTNLRKLVRKLLPGFILQDRSPCLADHFQGLQKDNTPNIELFDAWLDFIALRQKARPLNNLIDAHLSKLAESNLEDEKIQHLFELWLDHTSPDSPYEAGKIPEGLVEYFSTLPEDKIHKKLLAQWQAYCQPDSKTDAVWEYIKKPKPGFLVPIMTGYKAISPVYKNGEVANTRDNETDVCFVEAVHSVGEWQGVHHLRSAKALKQSIWHYHYEENWYLCQQELTTNDLNETVIEEFPDDDFS